ncbi:MAG: DNA polymerase III subunit delta [Bacteroidetes bacterium]|nr:DNA polymerase III subunit delta [Bacteroidota bacterium]MBU1720192.1 DNA polymerase III subunit delta [Bacteroidota bacterium]
MQFRDIFGQDAVKQRLIQTVRESRISHAQLFHGHEGTGKLALAIAYAQYICCENQQEDDSCGFCPSCIKYAKLVHPDLHFFFPVAATKNNPKDPSSAKFLVDFRAAVLANPYLDLNQWYEIIEMENKQGIINVNDCNEILRALSLKSYESEFKIVIIWMVEKLFHAAGPKLLKILEEPPQKTLFLLITENPDQILRTILSRTQMVRIPRLSEDELVQGLILRHQLDEPQARYMASISNGSYSEARRLLISGNSGMNYFPIFRNWMRLCFKNDHINICDWLEETAALGREKEKDLLTYSISVIHECLKLNTRTVTSSFSDSEEGEFMMKFTRFINEKNYLKLYKEFNEAAWHIERNGNARIIFMDLSLSVMNLLKR